MKRTGNDIGSDWLCSSSRQTFLLNAEIVRPWAARCNGMQAPPQLELGRVCCQDRGVAQGSGTRICSTNIYLLAFLQYPNQILYLIANFDNLILFRRLRQPVVIFRCCDRNTSIFLYGRTCLAL